MANPFDRYRNWVWRRKVREHPKLRLLPEAEAIQRLKLYTTAERDAMQPWLTIAYVVLALCAIGVLVAVLYWPLVKLGWTIPMLLNVALGLVTLALTRRVRARIKVKIAADIEAGRALECIACGYDLRGSVVEQCPECGAAAGTVPEPEPEIVPVERKRDPNADLPPMGFGQWS